MPPPPAAPTQATTLDEAIAAERGIHGPRDYARAAAIYASRCDEGRGDLEACAALLEAMGAQRGVAYDEPRAGALIEAMCERGDRSTPPTMRW